jgi:Patatin-like phospholipase
MTTDVEQLIDHRRTELNEPPRSQRGVWGLALSGGGIRSATFCFGLLRALAAKRLLLRFDLISTVSGGGYIGAMLGRLFQRATSKGDVELIVDRLYEASPRWFASWLRANGRYLIPRGARDRAFALAVYIRNMLAVHLELGMLGVLLGSVLSLVNLGGWSALAGLVRSHPDATLSWIRYWPDWLPTWLPTPWLLLPLVAWSSIVLLFSFWLLPWVSSPSGLVTGSGPAGSSNPFFAVLRRWTSDGSAATFCRTALAPLAIGVLIQFRDSALGPDNGGAQVLRQWLWSLALVTALAWLPAPAIARYWARTADQRPLARNVLTEALATLLRVSFVVLLIGLLDRVAWFIAFEGVNVSLLAGGLALTAGVLRGVLPLFSSTKRRSSPDLLLRVGGVVGYLATFLLLAFWVSLVQQVALASLLVDGSSEIPGGSRHVLDFGAALVAWAWLAIPVLFIAAFGGPHVAFLNQSSLHGFYRARLVRSYLGAANPARFASSASLGATDKVPEGAGSTPAPVTHIEPDDDLPFSEYAPHRHGGPVHLIGVCVNETTDPRGGLFNQDRRGQALTLAPEGRLRVGQGPWQYMKPDKALSLGSWTAISGAAIAPGLGPLTRGGISALTMFGGLRLGYWWDSTARLGQQVSARRAWSKLGGLLRETVGNFAGPAGRDWFLTDGGHFENTGAYALLAEEAELIVLADCGADPDYAFDDLENLVRKARIDLQAEVRFQKPRGPDTPLLPISNTTQDLLTQFGSLGDLASNSSLACFALAEVRYRSGAAEGLAERVGHLILVKPNLCAGLPVDLFNFKAKQPKFPQQSTADQFFDEAQWESYFQLGSVLGSRLNLQAIEGLLSQAGSLFVRDDGTPVEQLDGPTTSPTLPSGTVIGAAAKPVLGAISRIPERIAAGSITATLSLGAVATVGVSLWQAIDALRTSSSQRVKDERAALKELTDLWAPAAKAAPSDEPTQITAHATALAAALARVSDSLCSAGDSQWFIDSPLARNILLDALERCDASAQTRVEPACRWLSNDNDEMASTAGANCLMRGIDQVTKKAAQGCLHYWGYDYGQRAEARCAHPSDKEAAMKLALVRYYDEQLAWDRKVIANAGKPSTTALPTASRPSSGSASAPVAASAPAVATVASNSASGVTAAASGIGGIRFCEGKTVYLQIYGNDDRDSARQKYRQAWRNLGASVPPIEDVIATAKMRGTSAPLPVKQTTVRYHDIGSLSCAERLVSSTGESNWRIEPLSPGLKASRNVIEVWLAPQREAARGP